MAFNPKYVPIPMISDNIGMADVPILLPNNEKVIFCGQGDNFDQFCIVPKSLSEQIQSILPHASFTLTLGADQVQFLIHTTGWFRTLKYAVEPAVFNKKDWCKVTAYDTTRFNYSSYPLVVYFKANTRKIEQQNVVVKYDDEVGTIIPLSQKQFDVLTFTTQPMNSDYARLFLDIAEWDNVTFQHWDTENNAWSTAMNVAKKAEAWQKTTYPRTLGTTIQGSFVIKQ